MRRLRPARWSACCLVALAACGASSPTPQRRPPDKAALFGDPTLVPTRQGEAARLELARSGEITAALRATGWIDDVRVDVEHPETEVRAPSVVAHVVVAGRRNATSPVDLDDRVRAVVAGICAGDTAVTLALAEAPTADEPRERPRDLPRTLALGLALFGLGASLSLFADRAWRRRRRSITRRGGLRAPR